ncbi:MAG: hypothetical protein PVJ80_12885 [Gemmatimonadota bacterium]
MRIRALSAVLVSATLACSGGAPPALDYIVPGMRDVAYEVGDTVAIAVQVPGQSLEIGLRSAARYRLDHEQSGGGLHVTAAVERLAADVSVPLTEAMSMDETALEGDFEFDLDRLGHATSISAPTGSSVGAQVYAAGAPLIAHALFPRLPGRAVSSGDTWADSVSYRADGDSGESVVTSSLTYTVVGESQVAGRALTDIEFAGTAAVTQNLSLEGATITQESELEVTGRLRWDAAAGLLYDSELTMEGPGNVRMALLPAALPTKVTWHTRVRLDR